MRFEDVADSIHSVKPFKWLNRNLTVIMMGSVGMYDVMVVQEPGFNGEVVADATVVFSEVLNEIHNSPLLSH
ncbi:hypothetical protein NVP1072O_34 [Vibrio phage 1.072.O._10N.286.48.A12]|nr:hypothetical protein NVP1004O_33 [Vibrio phage 1.004.O._10N.261.54.A2]AUR83593.1 hypothetical protein NVP1037O_33 [Vibrio phage 1.037.O._10N.261.52.F7]AUR84478.1 hypothetical protein NVP1056O_36 [Vibrio phage 1.056.O._10N.261.48.C11]AUR84995.1 hypothetical protein NVP1066O_36 [Vibrio phage 1.066.O._10N.286.46.E8]AUR85126.1 hypothetical protein NVP1068O_36 [Vibrio phage 1.068.O._10N.261.51.F8]AUR85351.1 hypothetical protein NVP1072O_34 [Vibrio phage 1.072.O._10N.286.48.A12]